MRRVAIVVIYAIHRALAQPWPHRSYHSADFTPPVLQISRSSPTAPGYLLLAPNGPDTASQVPLILDDTGELIWYGPDDPAPQNFEVQELNGQSVLSYWTGFGAVGETFGHGYGSVKILDSTYRLMHELCPPDLKNFLTYDDAAYPSNDPGSCYLDQHEAFITERGSVVVTAYNVTQLDLTSLGGSQSGWAFDAQFYEIDVATQEVLFSWKHFDHLDSLPLSESYKPFTTASDGAARENTRANPYDSFHINSVQAVGDGFLVSARYYNSILHVARKGTIEWRLDGSSGGDFTLAPDVHFAWEHYVRTSARTISSTTLDVTLFANNNAIPPAFNGTNQTTGVSLTVDLATRQVHNARPPLFDPNDPVFTQAQGSLVPLAGGHMLMGYGLIAKIKEFDSEGAVVYTAQFGTITNQLPPLVQSYRVTKQRWVAEPFYAPDIVVRPKDEGGGAVVYMSWNGATEYDVWVVYAGSSRANLEVVGRVERDGFETEYALARGPAHAYIMVEAAQGNKALRNSSVVEWGMSANSSTASAMWLGAQAMLFIFVLFLFIFLEGGLWRPSTQLP